MAQAVRYITSTTVKRTTNQYGHFTATDWANTHNLRSPDGGDATTVNLASASGTMNTPGVLVSRGAQFLDIPLNARINWVRAEWRERCTNPSGGHTGRPNIPYKWVALLAVNGGQASSGKTEGNSIPYDYVTRSLTWQRSEIPKVTPEALRSGEVGIHLGFGTNTAGNHGIVRISFKRIVVDYTPPTYSLEASVQQNKKLGENLTYTVKVTNTNNAHNGVAVPVSINLPSGLSYVSQTGNGTYNKNTGKWNAVLSGPNGSATLTLTLKSTSVGSKSITATVDGFGTTLTRSTTILQPVFTITPNIPVSVVSGKDLTFTVSVKVDTDAVTSRNINVAVPSGFTFKSSTGSGSFNSSTGVWNAQFSNKTASRTFVYTAVTVGSHNIKITVSDTSTTATKTVIILSPDLTTPYYRYYELPEEIKNLMSHGKQYTVSVDCMVEDTVLPSIYDGLENFKIAIAVKNPVSGDLEDEILGSRPTELGKYQRIAVSFIYDEGINQVIKLNGQYPEISPTTSTVKYSRFAILEGDNELFEEGLPLFDNPQALIENGDYSNVDLDANLSSGPVKFEDVNFAGREDDPNIIIKGIGVKLDYHATEDMGVTVELQHKDIKVQKSQAVPAGESTTELGGEFDKWGLTDINLPDLSFQLKVSEINGNGSIFQVKNVRLVVYYQYDETGGNHGFIINGEHSRNYNMFLTGLESEAGMQLELDVLELDRHDGQLILGSSIEPKKVTIPFSVVGCSLSECEERLQDAVKWMSNTFDSAKRPIPNVLSFDWNPDKKYKVILEEAVKNDFEDGHLECTAEFLLPEGLAFEEETSLGAGVNDGLKPVSPVITIKTDGNPRILDDGTPAIVLKDSISGAELTIKHAVPVGETLIVDCKNRRIYRPQDEGKVNVELDNLVSLNVATGTMSDKNTNGFQAYEAGSLSCIYSQGRKRHVLRVNVTASNDEWGGWYTSPRITGFKQNTQYIALVYGVLLAKTRLYFNEWWDSGNSQSIADYDRTSYGYQRVQTSLTTTANGTEMSIAQRVIQDGYSGYLDILEVGLVEYDDEIPFWRVDYNTGKVTVLYDLSPEVTLDSTWPVLDVNKQYDFSESEGCVIQKVEYEKGV